MTDEQVTEVEAVEEVDTSKADAFRERLKHFRKEGNSVVLAEKSVSDASECVRLGLDDILLGEVDIIFDDETTIRLKPVTVRTVGKIQDYEYETEKRLKGMKEGAVRPSNLSDVHRSYMLFMFIANQHRGEKGDGQEPFTIDEILDLLDIEMMPTISALTNAALNPLPEGFGNKDEAETETETTNET